MKKDSAPSSLDSDDTKRESLPFRRRSRRRVDVEEIVIAIARTELVDDGKRVRGGKPNEEVDVLPHEDLKDFVRRITSIQNQYVARSETGQHLEKVIALTRCESRDLDVGRRLRANVEQDAHEHLWTVSLIWDSERVLEVRTSLQVDLRPVYGEDSLAAPALRFEARLEGDRSDLVDQVAEQFGSDLVACRAEGGCRHTFVGRQVQTVTSRLVPEGIEQVPIPASVAVGDHVEQKRRQELWLKRTAA